MASLHYDKHSLCSSCRGGDCDWGNKCSECLSWSKEEFDKFIKHRKALDAKSKNRKKPKDESKPHKNHDNVVVGKTNGKDQVVDKTNVTSLDGGDDDAGVAQNTGESVSRSVISEMISNSVAEFSNSFRSEFNSVISDAFNEINDILDRRVGKETDQDVGQDVSNPSISEHPPQAPVQLSCPGRQDPLDPYPTTNVQAACGRKASPEFEGRHSSLSNFIASLVGKG